MPGVSGNPVIQSDAAAVPDSDWYAYGRSSFGDHFSPLTQINTNKSTPMSYSEAGKQFIVTAAGGHGSFHTKLGDYIVAYTLGE